MTTFRIGPPPVTNSQTNFQTSAQEAAFQRAFQPIQPAANAQPTFQSLPFTQPLQQAPAQPALQPITQVLQQATAQPTSRPVTPLLQQSTTPTFVRPVTPILQESSAQTVLRPVTPTLQEATAQVDLRPASEVLQPIPQILQPAPSETSIEPIPVSQPATGKVFNQEVQPIEVVDMSEQLYQITGANGQPMIVTASQLVALNTAANQTQPQYVVQQPQQPVQYVVQQPDSRPTSVYYTAGSQGQIVTPPSATVGAPMVVTSTGAPQVVTTTAHGVPVVTQPQKDDDLLSFYDPTWYKKQSSAGSLTGTTLAWLIFALLLLIFILHVIAFGAPYWIWYTLTSVNFVNLGLWQACETLTGCHNPDTRIPTALLSYFQASQALAGIVLAGIIIMLIIFLVFLSKAEYKKNLEIVFMVVTFITGVLLLTLIALFDAQIRKYYITSTIGASFILEIITLVFIIIIEIIAIADYALSTNKL